ncbi:MAG: molybdopterin-dependent oxidoreductase [Thermoplasmata archaeon]|nr:molybdopterin-dependent oxidoreductase [Thermoplasmata archaeon]
MVLRTVCARDCYDSCLMEVRVENGRIKKVSGTKTHPFTSGFLCPKGYFYPHYQHSEKRVLYPMKRAGKKGEGKFERCSWSEALKTIAEKVRTISSEFSPLSILVYDYAGHMGFLSRYFPYRFFNKINASFLDHTLCDVAGTHGLQLHFGTTCGVSPLQIERAKLIVVWGSNPYSTSLHTYNKILRARGKGAIVAVVDPVRTRMAENADVYFQVKPGSDALLAYALIKIMIKSQVIDYEFIKKFTVGFEELKAVAETVELESVEKLTGVSVEKLSDFAGLLATLKPQIFIIGYGMQRRTIGGNAVRAVSMLPVLTGSITGEGGIIYSNALSPVEIAKFTARHLRTIDERKFNMVEIGKVLANPRLNPPVKMVFVYNSNPCATLPNQKLVRKGFEREDLFTVVHDLFLTETAMYADLLLPAKSMFEFEDIVFSYLLPSVAKQNKIVETPGESLSNVELAREMAKTMEFNEPELFETEEQLIASVLEFLPESAKNEFQKEGYIILEVNPAVTGFPTKSGKIEIASTSAWRSGAPKVPLPLYEKCDGLWLLTPLNRNTIHTQFVRPETEPISSVYLNPEDAERLEVSNGDFVIIESISGKLEKMVEIWDAVPAGTVLLYFDEEANILTTDEKADLGGGGAYNSTVVKMRKKAQ